MTPYIGYVRLMTGDNIIGFVTQQDDKALVIERPLSIIFEPDEKNAVTQGVLLFYPWLPVSAVDVDSVELGNSKYLFCIPISKNLVSLIQKYMEKCYELKPSRYQDLTFTPSVGSTDAANTSDPFADLENLLKTLGKGTPPKDTN